MEPGYLSLDWNHIPGLFRRKEYMRTLMIPPADLERLCDPANLKKYWEPDNQLEHYHTTLALAFVWDKFHDCADESRRQEMVVSVAVVRKPAQKSAMTFQQAVIELKTPSERASTLLLVRLHRESDMFPDSYYHDRSRHFAIMYDTGEDYNCGSPLRFTGAELLSAYEPGKTHSLWAKLPPSWRLNSGVTHPVESCVWEYKDWTTGRKGVTSPETHFPWISDAFVPFTSVPGQDIVLLDNMLGLPPVDQWPVRGGPIPWILNPAEHPRPDDPNMSQSLGVTGNKKRKRSKKKELRVTQKGTGDDEPQMVSYSGSSGTEASDTTTADSGVNLASPVPSRSKKAKISSPTAGSHTSWTPPLSPDTRQELDTETPGGNDSQVDDDNPLSGASDHVLSDPEVEVDHKSSGDESSDENDGEDGGGKNESMDAKTAPQRAPPAAQNPATPSTSSNPATGTAPMPSLTTAAAPGAPSGNPGGTPGDSNAPDPSAALAYAIQARVLASPALAVVMAQIGPGFALDGGEEDKALQEEYQGVMRGLRGVARIMSTEFEKASSAVQDVVNRSLARVIRHDLRFIEGASSTLVRWVQAVQPAIDSLDRLPIVQRRLRGEARRDGMKIAWEILDPYDVVGADDPNLDPLHEIIVRAFAATWTPTEEAIIEVHEQLAPLAEQHVPPGQERVFLSGAFNVICAYIQEVCSMVLGQAVLLTQIVPGIWGAWRGILAEAPLLAPQIGPVPALVPTPEPEKPKAPEKVEAGIQSNPAPPPAVKPLTTKAPAQRVQPKLLVAPLSSSTKSPAKLSKAKGIPRSAGKQTYTQQTVRSMWEHPDRAREDEAFERSRAQNQPREIPVVIMADENVEKILAGCRPSQLVPSSRPAATVTKPKATSSSTRASSSGPTRSGRASPTQVRLSGLTVPMPAPIQMPAHRKPVDNVAPPGS